MLDLLIKNVDIIDGTGAQPFLGSIGVKDGRITFVKREVPEISADKIIDGTGLIACPGFIDAHGHVDISLDRERGTDNFIMQGVTTSVGGHCGIGFAPVGNMDFAKKVADSYGYKGEIGWSTFGEWLEHMDSLGGIGINYVPLVPHGAIRGAVLGLDFTRESTLGEIEKIVVLLREALESGAFGMSASLDAGVPGHFAGRDEILSLLQMLAAHRCIFAPHTRHHQNQWPSSRTDESAYGLYNGPHGETITGRYHGLLEVIEYTYSVPGLNTMISHLTPIYIMPQPHPTYVDDAIRRATLEEIIDRPRADGLNISFNAIPVPYSISYVMNIADTFMPSKMILPDWLKGLSREEFVEKLEDAVFRDELTRFVISGRFKFDMICPATDPYWSREFIIHQCKNKELEGRTPFEAAIERSPHNREYALYHTALDVLYDIIREDPDATWYFNEDRRVDICQLQHPMSMVATDVCSFPGDVVKDSCCRQEKLKTGAYNAVPYYLEKLVKQDGTLSLTEAIRKLTTLPAEIIGIKERGCLCEGFWADITLMDWDSLKTSHDFNAPATHTRGMEYVIVNGRVAYEKGILTRVLSGKILRKENPRV